MAEPRVSQRRRLPDWPWALLVILAAGTGLRLLLVVSDWPTARRNADVYPFVTAAHSGLFSDQLHPAGYAAFLRVLHTIWGSALFPTLVQHALGVLGAYLLYDTARRLGAPRWLAVVPTAVLALSIDQIATEHLLMSDSLSGFLVIACLWLIVRATLDRVSPALAAAAGAMAIVAFLVRATGLVLVPLLVVVVLIRARDRRWVSAGAVVVAMVLVAVPYFVTQHAITGRWSLTQASGWSQYVRVASFADCDKFDPPEGTEFLCESSDPDSRGGPDFYAWGGGPAREKYGSFELGNDELRRFSSAVIKAQPFEYLSEVLHDFVRFFVPIEARHNPGGGSGPWAQSVETLDPATAQTAGGALEGYYGNLAPIRRTRGLSFLGTLQPYLRIGTYQLTAACVLAIAGFARRRRAETLMCLWVVLSTLLLCTATANYTWRYALPVIPIACLGAAIGVTDLLRRQLDATSIGAGTGERAGLDGREDDLVTPHREPAAVEPQTAPTAGLP